MKIPVPGPRCHHAGCGPQGPKALEGLVAAHLAGWKGAQQELVLIFPQHKLLHFEPSQFQQFVFKSIS